MENFIFCAVVVGWMAEKTKHLKNIIARLEIYLITKSDYNMAKRGTYNHSQNIWD